MANNEFTSPIPARLKNVAKGGHVAGAEDIIDDALGKEQSEINQDRIDDVSALDTKIAAEKQRAESVEGNLNTRLNTVEQLAEISIEGGEIGIATAEDMKQRTPAGDAKIPTVAAILDSVDEEPTAGSKNLVDSNGVASSVIASGTYETYDYSQLPVREISLNKNGNWWGLGGKHIAIPVKEGEVFVVNSATTADNLQEHYDGGTTIAFCTDSYDYNISDLYTRVPVVDGTQVIELGDNEFYEVVVPHTAKWLVINMEDRFNSRYSINVYKKASGGNVITNTNSIGKIRIMSWNVGHWSGGAQTSSTITNTNYDYMKKAYNAILRDTNPDIVGLCEFSETFNTSDNETAAHAIFQNYKQNAISEFIDYWGVALFWNGIKIENWNETTQFAPGYRLFEGIAHINKKLYIIGIVHAPWDEDFNLQAFNKIVEKYSQKTNVILFGDFNPTTKERYELLKAAGFELANCGIFGEITTYTGDNSPLDNICVKGCSVKNVFAPICANIQHKEWHDMGNETGYFTQNIESVAIGRNFEAQDGKIYNISDHLPIVADIIF